MFLDKISSQRRDVGTDLEARENMGLSSHLKMGLPRHLKKPGVAGAQRGMGGRRWACSDAGSTSKGLGKPC